MELSSRDVDIELSEQGRQQAQALGRALAELAEPPTVLVGLALRTRPRRQLRSRSRRPARPARRRRRAAARAGVRRSGRELTGQSIRAGYPEEAERRRRLGTCYHRPPRGESWSDVLLRMRAALADLMLRAPGERVLLVGHQVGVLLVRYVLEQLDEPGSSRSSRRARSPTAR